MKKKILGLGLATIILTSTVACTDQTQNVGNEDNDMKTIEEQNKGDNNKDEQDTVEKEMDSKYVIYSGNISEFSKEDKSVYVTVDTNKKEDTYEKIRFNVSGETLVLSDKTQDAIDVKTLKEGMTVEVFFPKDAPMTRSIPPMTNATAIVLRESGEESKFGVKIDTFNKELVSSDNSLQLKTTEETVIVDRDGKKLSKEDIVDKEVLVFFGPIMTMSMPGQSEAVKIILLETSK